MAKGLVALERERQGNERENSADGICHRESERVRLLL